jgi:hypothetical protein
MTLFSFKGVLLGLTVLGGVGATAAVAGVIGDTGCRTSEIIYEMPTRPAPKPVPKPVEIEVAPDASMVQAPRAAKPHSHP